MILLNSQISPQQSQQSHRMRTSISPSSYNYTTTENTSGNDYDDSSQWHNQYRNPLNGAPAEHLINTPKSTIDDITNGMVKRDMRDMYTHLEDIDMSERIFIQMQDPSLMDFRGVVVDDNLPNENLVLELDFGGATSSNKML